MFESLSRRSHRFLNTMAYAGLIALVASLGYLVTQLAEQRGQDATAIDSAEHASLPLVELDGYQTRQERNSESEHLTVSVRLRLNTSGSLDSWVFVIARNDHMTPKLWAAWPEGAEAAISAGGHFRGNSPGAGHHLNLTSSWTRLSARLQHPQGVPPFESVVIYIVNAKGEIVLARPFPAS